MSRSARPWKSAWRRSSVCANSLSSTLIAALERRLPCGHRPRRLDGEAEAYLVALACSPAPAGHVHWTIHLLADKEVLAYIRPYDPRCPQVCLDEANKQLVSETRVPIQAKPGQMERYDYEYERQGVYSLFLCFEPLAGGRHVTVSTHRTKHDLARVLRDLVDVHYPEAEKIVLVMDNLNTHDFSALYETFEPQEAWRIREKIEIHYTPKHGSWLNMAEIELAVLSGQCMDRRIGEEVTLRREAAAWETERNSQQVRVNWRFTTQDVRIKLKRLYPVLETECPGD